ncbi:hypothetical protein BHM03_00026449 [Ensete ventricosum]|nr:hypothetical protein BHM03_00026449 [Ensete ventricosum]
MVEVLYFSQPKSDLKFVILSRAFFYYGPGIGFPSRRAISFIGWAFDNNVNLLLYRRGEVPLSDLTNSLYTSSRHQVTWRSYTLRKLAKSKDEVSSSRWLGVVVRELGAYQDDGLHHLGQGLDLVGEIEESFDEDGGMYGAGLGRLFNGYRFLGRFGHMLRVTQGISLNVVPSVVVGETPSLAIPDSSYDLGSR